MMLRVSLRRQICKVALPTGLVIYFLQIALKNTHFQSQVESIESSHNELLVNTRDSLSKRNPDERSLETTDVIVNANQDEINGNGGFRKYENVVSDVPGECKGNLTMFVGVMSGPEARRDRNMIRTLWGHKKVASKVAARVVFFIGRVDSTRIQRAIDREMSQHEDIVQFDLVDDYDNLTNKSLSMMRWFEEHCKDTKWYVKADVDSFWNIYGLKALLESHNNIHIINNYTNSSGDFNAGFDIASNLERTTRKSTHYSTELVSAERENMKESSKWSNADDPISVVCPRAAGLRVCREFEEDRCEERYVVSKEEYPPDLYPPHCHGFSYVLRRDLVMEMLKVDEERLREGLQRFRMEDVYVTGILVKDIHVEFIDISSQTMSFPKSVSEVLRRPLLLIHGPERWLLQGSARQIWDHFTADNQEKRSTAGVGQTDLGPHHG